jgi:hypothetical protein
MFPAHFIHAISQWLTEWIKLEIKLETPGVRASNYSRLGRDKVESVGQVFGQLYKAMKNTFAGTVFSDLTMVVFFLQLYH